MKNKMSHCIGYKVYNGDRTPTQILGDLNTFAYDPMETSRYHGNLTFHPSIVCESQDAATERIEKFIKDSYDDHAVRFLEDGKEHWLVKYEYHC